MKSLVLKTVIRTFLLVMFFSSLVEAAGNVWVADSRTNDSIVVTDVRGVSDVSLERTRGGQLYSGFTGTIVMPQKGIILWDELGNDSSKVDHITKQQFTGK